MIAIPTLRIESAAFRERFEQRGLPTPILANEKCDIGPKRYIDSLRQRLDVERVSS